MSCGHDLALGTCPKCDRVDVWVLKNTEDKYLAATVFTKFNHVTMGDLVPEQQYARRFYSRNAIAKMANDIRNNVTPWRIVKLRSPRDPKR